MGASKIVSAATNSQRYILGIDPGLAITGYGLVQVDGLKLKLVEAGVIRVSRSQTLERRLRELYDGITEVMALAPLEAVAIEQLYSHYERPRTAVLMGHARGVLCLAAAQRDLAVYSFEPTAVKKALTGNGRASKEQMQFAVQHQLGLRSVPEPADVADALGVAICCCGHQQMQSQTRTARPVSE